MSQPLNTQQIDDATNLCRDPDTEGFDLFAGKTWIYPTNYPIREYQFNITQSVLYQNTFVSLPTGLGKTFIAAVVMYNYYRWYPHGKIIFMAPTRPLVKQQIDACYSITAIPPETTAELTGSKLQASRSQIWSDKRVFFVTPQVLQNDLDSVLNLGEKIKCLVFDEAHRAKGNHAYCEVIRKLSTKTKLFRVVALSATPGNSVKDVLEVLQNLQISHLEFRTEESLDVRQYVFERSLETVVVPLGDKLQEFKEIFMKVLDRYTKVLINYKVITGNYSNLSKGKIFMVMKEFQAKNQGGSTPHYAEIMRNLQVCITLFHAYELLIRHGLRGFLNFLKDHISKPLIRNITPLIQITEDVEEYLGPTPSIEPAPDGSYAEIPPETKFGHPKFYRLRDILIEHFSTSDPTSRVIVFFEYRDSVTEAQALLLQSRPLIRSKVFLGQGSGVTQKIQLNVVKAFREGTCNTLLSTCIGEEGLDVGEVNLIVCFDVSNKSPIRMIQRMGRTGRKKEGRIIVLVTEGREQQTLKDCLICKSNLETFVMNSHLLTNGLYKNCPKMVPAYIKPQCQKVFITVKKPVVTKKNTLKDMFRRAMSKDGPNFFDEDVENVVLQERIEIDCPNLWNSENPLEVDWEAPKIDFSKKLEKLRSFQPIGEVGHSIQCQTLVHLLQYADSKRFNIPVTQGTNMQFKNVVVDNRNLKQGDIRSMFTRTSNDATGSQESQFMPSQRVIISRERDPIEGCTPELLEEILNYLTIEASAEKELCSGIFKCMKDCFSYKRKKVDFSTWVVPDASTLDTITAESFDIFADSLTPKSKEIYSEFNDDQFDDIQFTQLEKDALSNMGQTNQRKEESFLYQPPNSLAKILDSFRVCASPEEQFAPATNKSAVSGKNDSLFQPPKSLARVLTSIQMCDEEFRSQTSNNFFQQPKSSIWTENKNNDDNTSQSTKSPAKTSDSIQKSQISSAKEKSPTSSFDLDATIILSPDIKSSIPNPTSEISPDLFESPEEADAEDLGSPVLSSCTSRMQSLKETTKRKLFEAQVSAISSNSGEAFTRPNLGKLKLPHTPIRENASFGRQRKILETKTPEKRKLDHLMEDISSICDLSQFGLKSSFEEEVKRRKISTRVTQVPSCSSTQKSEDKEALLDSISDICDLSMFGIGEDKLCTKKTLDKCNETTENLNVEDIFDLSQFFVNKSRVHVHNTEEDRNSVKKKYELEVIVTSKEDNNATKEENEFEMSVVNDFVDISHFYNNTDFEKQCNRKPNCVMKTRKCQAVDTNLSIPSSTKSKLHNTKMDKNSTKQKHELEMNVVNDIADMSDFFSDADFEEQSNRKTADINISVPSNTKSKLNLSPNAVIDLTPFVNETITPPSASLKPTRSQLSITQMLSFVNRPSQKENIFSTPKVDRSAKDFQAFSLTSKENTPKRRILQLKQNYASPKSSQKKKKTTPDAKRVINIALPLDSDEDFETSCVLPKSKLRMNKIKTSSPKVVSRKVKKQRKISDFIDDEAALSEEEDVAVSEDEDSGEDCFEASFVADETEADIPCTQMHVQYLKSVRSPPVGRGKFKIPQKFKHNISNVFSQEVCNDESYLNDSFCVDSEEADVSEVAELSHLEKLELRIKEITRKKRKKSKENSGGGSKRRRILIMSDDSDNE